jgi:hypothetical protein
VKGQIKLLGGNKRYIQMLDDLFNEDSPMEGREQADITGLIGQYAHGNEPSHHIAYLYTYAGEPWKTQKIVKAIVTNMYKTGPSGLCGNEDCGQMSSWYVFSALGFYPVLPGSDQYVLGTPFFKEAFINLENGNKFVIKATGLSDTNFYVRSVRLNGKKYKNFYIKHEDIMKGGTLTFDMGPSTEKGNVPKNSALPLSSINENPIIINPYSGRSKKSFEKKFLLELKTPDKKGKIYYSLNRGNKFLPYKKPLKINRSSEIWFFAEKNGRKSGVVTSEYVKIPFSRKIKLLTEYSKLYTGGGDKALIDGIKGENDFKTGGWQGYSGVDLDVVIDLKKIKEIKGAEVSFLQDINSWIFMPEYVDFFISKNGENYTPAGRVNNKVSLKKWGSIIQEFKVDKLKARGRYIRIFGKNIGICPDWHKGRDGKAWIFADEIIIK